MYFWLYSSFSPGQYWPIIVVVNIQHFYTHAKTAHILSISL